MLFSVSMYEMETIPAFLNFVREVQEFLVDFPHKAQGHGTHVMLLQWCHDKLQNPIIWLWLAAFAAITDVNYTVVRSLYTSWDPGPMTLCETRDRLKLNGIFSFL